MSRLTTIVFTALVAAATLAGLATVAIALSLHQTDSAGYGMSSSYAMNGAIITWVLPTVVLVIGLAHVARPAWTPWLVLPGFTLSKAAALTVINVLKDDAHVPAQWPMVTLIGAPLLVLEFAMGLPFPPCSISPRRR